MASYLSSVKQNTQSKKNKIIFRYFRLSNNLKSFSLENEINEDKDLLELFKQNKLLLGTNDLIEKQLLPDYLPAPVNESDSCRKYNSFNELAKVIKKFKAISNPDSLDSDSPDSDSPDSDSLTDPSSPTDPASDATATPDSSPSDQTNSPQSELPSLLDQVINVFNSGPTNIPVIKGNLKKLKIYSAWVGYIIYFIQGIPFTISVYSEKIVEDPEIYFLSQTKEVRDDLSKELKDI